MISLSIHEHQISFQCYLNSEQTSIIFLEFFRQESLIIEICMVSE